MRAGEDGIFLLLLCFTLLFELNSASLYNSTDEVVILDHGNFSSTVHGTDNAWVVEFYNTWCGHCVQFAPIWKRFGKDVKDWEHTVKVGVLDCAEDENVPICREHDIMAYPTIRLFAAYASKGDTGSDMPHLTSVRELEEATINFLVEKQKANNGSKSWVNLQPYKGAAGALFEQGPKGAEWAVMVVDKVSSHAARAVLLDLAGYPSIVVRYKEAEAEDVRRFGSAGLPAVIITSRDRKEDVLSNIGQSRDEVREAIIKKLGLNPRMLASGKKNSSVKEEREGAGDGQPEEINKDKLNYGDDLPDAAFTGMERSDQVFMVDIENAISYALNHEVAQHKAIRGDALLALQELLDILVRYLPARPQVHSFLSKFQAYILNHGDSIEGSKVSEIISSLQSTESVLPSQQPWIGCAGSESKYRGYPCGLWTTFHVLTVNAVLQDGSKKFYNPLKTIKAIHGYVKHFFGCSYCSQHFQAMYAEDAESSIRAADDSIMWLWQGHNKVNKRLKGDASEDPHHPKQQFPPPVYCPSCWQGEKFIEEEVLKYLKTIYAKGSLSFRGTEIKSAPPRNKQEKVQQQLDSYRKEKKHSEVLTSDQDKKSDKDHSPQNIGIWGFTNTDISLCVFLYGASTIIIMAVYCSVVIRRKMRRKRFLEAYKLPFVLCSPLLLYRYGYDSRMHMKVRDLK
ncbi:sulfhydryl oxidase 2-like isoform X3 [Eriocheir sinensis]|uniref:sulfhydryl oxidase 2-like isoform X3 n=1 Tax=Eriocheir sinensis TaxID=95602 RepID=UPI0021C9A0AB|nr:sulfhydryl oxidase 2-like isoform X3 [Eriocheir sinensis]